MMLGTLGRILCCERLGGGVDGAYIEQNGTPMASRLGFSFPRKLVFHPLVTLPLNFSKTCGSIAEPEVTLNGEQ